VRVQLNGLGSRELLQLLAVADEGSIRRASEALGLTQPGLSKNIRLIEQRLGMTVFNRTPSGAVPTELGNLLLQRGRQIVMVLANLQRDLRHSTAENGGHVSFGCGPAIVNVVQQKVIPHCQTYHPGISINLEIGVPATIVQLVAQGALEFAVCTSDGAPNLAGASARLIAELVPVFVVRRGHPLAQQSRVTLADLARWKLAIPHMPPRFLAWFGEVTGADTIAIGVQCDDIRLLASICAHSDMLCILPPQDVQTVGKDLDLVALEVPGVEYVNPVFVYQLQSRILSRPARTILERLESVLCDSVDNSRGSTSGYAGSHNTRLCDFDPVL
jgi:DNA-binding transcriptional LysR family regulator